MQVNIDINKNINSSIYLETGSGLFGPGQFGPGQFGPRQFDTRTIRSRIIRYQDNSVQGQLGPEQFGPKNRKKLKFDSSFYSTDSGSYM